MNCQICGSNEKKVLAKLCSNMDIMGPFFKGKESYIASCKTCGHVYVDMDAGQKAFTDYYNSNYSKSLSYYEVFGREEAEVYYENIEKRIHRYIGKTAKILEIGGGIGELASYLMGRGYTDITVMEPSERCIRLCEEAHVKTILSDGFDVPAKLGCKYDFIIINHTLEHILRFDLTLNSARKMLKENGFLYVEVPDAAYYAKSDFVPYWYFTYEHIFHMTLRSFEQIAAAFDFEIQEKESYLKCHSYQVMYAVFKKTDGEKKQIPAVWETAEFVEAYISMCEKKLEPLTQKLAEGKEPLILWGVGTSTAQLLNGNFDKCNVVKLVDSNPYRQKISYFVAGKELSIEDPGTIRETDGTIVILPLMYDASIRRQIHQMGLKNKLQSLIDNSQFEGRS